MAGFEEILVYRRKPVRVTREALVSISMYPRFADGIFENYEPKPGAIMPEPEAQSNFLVQSVYKRNISGLSRIWRDYLMRKPTTYFSK